MRSSLKKAWEAVDARIEAWLITAFYGYFCVIILVEVVRRYVFGDSSTWGEMTARYAFVYLVYIGVAEVAKTRDHIRIDLIPSRLGPKARLALYIYFDILYLILAALVIYYSIEVVGLSIRNDTLMPGFSNVNIAYAQAALPIGAALLVYRVVQRFGRTLRSYITRGEVPLGGGGFGES